MGDTIKTIYVKIGSESYESGDYRCWGITTDYFKIYYCKNCRKEINPSNSFCPNCGAKLNGKVDDFFVDKCKKLLTKKKREKNKLIDNVNGKNYYEYSKAIQKLDDNIEYIEEALRDWKGWDYKGSLPHGYNTIMNESI